MKDESEWFYYDELHYSKEFRDACPMDIYEQKRKKLKSIRDIGGEPHVEHFKSRHLSGIWVYRIGELLPEIKPLNYLTESIEALKKLIPELSEISKAEVKLTPNAEYNEVTLTINYKR